MSNSTSLTEHDVEILIAQNSPTAAEDLKQVLEARGHAVTVVANGKQALAAARTSKPALIVSDIVMPEMDGYALCKRLKTEKELKDVPVILMTALSSPEDVVKGLECGADIFIRTPDDEAAFVSRINYALSNRKLREHAKMDVSLQVQLGDKIHHITSEPQQILDLLISTYEDAIRINTELVEKQKELASLAAGLERQVQERTAALRVEIDGHQIAAEQLRQSEEQFRLIAENIADLIAVLDLEGKRLYNSPSYKDILGDPLALLGTDSFDEIHPDDRENVRKIFQETVATGRGQRAEYRFLLKDGRIRYIESQGSVIPDEKGKTAKVIVVSRDVTERNRLEERLRQAQKMEAIGRLAAGIAHDFNNLLTIIIGYSDVMLDRFASSDPMRLYTGEIKGAGERAVGLTRQLLAFSRQQVLAPQVLDLNTLIANLIRMLIRLIGEDVDLVFSPGPSPATVKADSGLIEQVLINLAVNSRDAMPRGGKLTIETSHLQVDEAYNTTHFSMPVGPYIMLAVSDTGCGMDKDIQAHIFEPFFTTKEVGKGTGLGLATVYGIVKQSGGNIWVYSEPGAGTTFKIYLPAIEGTPQAASGSALSLGGSETILLVEDNASLREMARMVLVARGGYKVLESIGGKEARVFAEQFKGTIHLLLTDVVMPGMSGRQLSEELEILRPEMKILYMSGFTDDTVVRHGVLEEKMAFLQKPFTAESLLRKVREVLDTRP